MTNEEAIKILRDTPIDIRSTREDDIHTLYATAQNMAIDALKQTTWIPVEERLPEADEPVLVSLIYQDKKFVSVDWVSDVGVWQEYRRSSVTAWMPLPEPYREDGEA